MGFLVGDKQPQRHAKIKGFIHRGEPEIAILLAAVDFEWTVRRAIVALGTSPNADIRGKLSSSYGLDKYKDAWRDEVGKRLHRNLPKIVGRWDILKKTYNLRHKLIHGVIGVVIDLEKASECVSTILAASTAIAEFARENNHDLFQKLPVRKRKKPK